MSSGSERSPSRERSRSKERVQKNKLFITNLDGTAKEEELQSELDQLFGKYGAVKELSVKRSKTGDYSFAFVEYEPGVEAEEAIRNLNNFMVKGKPMKVEMQDDGKRRKDPDKGCYTCGRKGHFARECRSDKNNNSGYYRGRDRDRRSRSRSNSDDRGGRRRRNRSQTPSSEKRRSRHKKDKERKHSSKDKDRKKKKHKKSRHRSSSDSDS